MAKRKNKPQNQPKEVNVKPDEQVKELNQDQAVEENKDSTPTQSTQPENKTKQPEEDKKQPETTPVEKEDKEQPEVNVQDVNLDQEIKPINNMSEVPKALKASKTVDDVLNNLSNVGDIKHIVARLKRFVEKRRKVEKEDEYVSNNYNLYMLLKEIIEKPNYGEFKTLFDIINKLFLLGNKATFNSIHLSKYDYKWKWGGKSHRTYHRLITLISDLANPGKRKNVKVNIDVLEDINDTGKKNLIRYYNIIGG